MKQLLTFLFILAFTVPTFSQEDVKAETTTYYFIRHAEKDRSDKNNKNPHLTQEGFLRAAKWALALENVPLDAVYSTDYNRTKETAQPTAEMKGLDVKLYDPRNLFSAEFAAATKGKKVLVVGHSNTTPAFVNTILKNAKYKDIDDRNNANLYIVTITGSGEIIDTLLLIE